MKDFKLRFFQNILTELKARQKESHIVECLGDTFVSEGLKFKVCGEAYFHTEETDVLCVLQLYAVYCSNQSHVVRRIKEYSDENEEFAVRGSPIRRGLRTLLIAFSFGQDGYSSLSYI